MDTLVREEMFRLLYPFIDFWQDAFLSQVGYVEQSHYA